MFTNEIFSLLYSYVSILEIKGTENTSPVQTSRHTNVRNEIAAFSAFLNKIRENFSNNEISSNVKNDLQKILAWFIIDNFAHNIDLIAQARKNFRENAAESLQMTMNPYHMGGSSITSNKPLKVFTGTDPEYSVEDYLNAVTANLKLK